MKVNKGFGMVWVVLYLVRKVLLVISFWGIIFV